MCVILFALSQTSRYKFVLAANRDEFYERPTATAQFWKESPNIFAGKDLAQGGTWLGVTKKGRFSAVTNYRQPNAPKGTRSRGNLVKDFLLAENSGKEYLQEIQPVADEFSGFNLLVGNLRGSPQLSYFSNRGKEIVALEKGIFGLSNHLLDTNWHKVKSGKETLKNLLESTANREMLIENLFQMLTDQTFAKDEDLPNTGVGIEREKILSPIFIKTPIYGTRCSTVLLLEEDGDLTFVERTFSGTPRNPTEIAQTLNLKNGNF